MRSKQNSDKIINFLAVGDLMLGDQTICLGHGVRSTIEKNGVDFIFGHVKMILMDSDILFGNLEVPLSEHGNDSGEIKNIHFIGKPDYAKMLSQMGFKCLSLANNHSTQHGQEAFVDTVDNLRKNGILPVGQKKDSHFQEQIISTKNTKIGFLSYSQHLDSDCSLVNCVDETSQIIAEITQMKKKSDILCVSIHWGEEYMQYPTSNQIELAHKIIDAGANIILGHHPHVIQGIERYNGGVIAYSLGNFVFDMWPSITRQSMILQIYISECHIQEYTVIPVLINRKFQIIPVSEDKAPKEIEKIKKLSQIIENRDHEIYRDTQAYEKLVRDKRRWNKKHIKLYFLKNVYRYPPGVRKQLMKRGFGRLKNK